MLLFSLLFLLGTFFLTAFLVALRTFHEHGAFKNIEQLKKRFFYYPIHKRLFLEGHYPALIFGVTTAQSIVRFFFAISTVLYLIHLSPTEQSELLFSLVLLLFLLLSFVIGDWMPRILGTQAPEQTLRMSSPVVSVFLFLALPVTYLFYSLTRSFSKGIYLDTLEEPETQAKKELIELIRSSDIKGELKPSEKKLISSVISFCSHVAKEVMIPRVDLFAMEGTTSIKKAAVLLEEEGYSRVPVYKDNIDQITGILMYKDILNVFRACEEKGDYEALLQPISSVQKPALFTPETKKISELLRLFQQKQTHLAIIVDEYGGTEGIVTIEDILEDIVGEIADEYDEDEMQITSSSEDTWLIDARMSIIDLEEQLGIKIPQEGGDYDTLAGYLFYCAGEIPHKGFTVDTDEFTLEVMRSSDRCVESVKLHRKEHELQQKDKTHFTQKL